MTNNQKYHKNYTEFGEPYQLVLPLNLEGLVPEFYPPAEPRTGGIRLQLAVSGLFCQRQKSSSKP